MRYGNHIPLLIAQGSQDTIMINTEIPPQLHERRFEIMTQAGKFLAKDVQLGQLEQVFFVSEGWMSKGGEEKEPIIPPSKDPERIEVLLISSIDIAKNDQFEMILYEMVRDEEGTLSGLSEVEGMKNKEGGQGESYILNAFIEGYRKETYQHN